MGNVIKRLLQFNKFKYLLNSFFSVTSRFLLTYIFADYFKFNFVVVYIATYIFVLLQSYTISKFFVFQSNRKNLLAFSISNISFTVIEYFAIMFIQKNTVLNYSFSTFIIGLITFFIRYYIYKNLIFSKNEW